MRCAKKKIKCQGRYPLKNGQEYKYTNTCLTCKACAKAKSIECKECRYGRNERVKKENEMNANEKSKEKHPKNKNKKEKKQTSKDDLIMEVDNNNRQSVINHYHVLGHYVASNFICQLC